MHTGPDPSRAARAEAAALRAAAQPDDALLDGYWVRFPAALRRYSVLLAEAWRDGIFLTARPAIAKAAPVAALAIGLVAGVVRQQSLPGLDHLLNLASGEAITYVQMVPFLLLVAAAGALSANLGLLITLGYAIGDFLTNGQPLHFVYDTSLPWTVFARVLMLTSYLGLGLLAVMPTLTTKVLTLRLPQALNRAGIDSVLIAGGAMALLQGVQVYFWTLAAPMLMRVLWAGAPPGTFPPTGVAYYVQTDGGWIVAAAVIGVGVRVWLTHAAFRRQEVAQRVRRLGALLRAADAHPAVTRRLPPWVRAPLAAAVITLLLSGIIGTALVGLLVFVYLTAVLELRLAVLPGWAPWAGWTRLMGKIPIFVRLIVAGIVAYLITLFLVNATINLPLYSGNPGGTYQPMLIAVCVSLLVMVIPFPVSRSSSTPAGAARSASGAVAGAPGATAVRREVAQ